MTACGEFWGPLRSALEGDSAGALADALRTVEKLSWDERGEVRDYLRGKLRERPQLIDFWPLFIMTKEWTPVVTSLGHFSSPDAHRQLIAGQSRATSREGALMPFEALALGQVGTPRHGWDEVIWEEVVVALRLCALTLKRHSSSPTPEMDEAYWAGFEECAYAFHDKIKAVLVDYKGRTPQEVAAALYEVRRGGLDYAVDGSLSLIYAQAVGEGASSLVALAGVYLRTRSYAHDRGLEVRAEVVQAWWVAACRRLFTKALEMGEVRYG